MVIPHPTLDLRQLRQDALGGRITVEQLLDIISKQQQTIQRQQASIGQLTERLAQYEPEVRNERSSSAAMAMPAAYSLEAESKRRQKRKRRQKSPGRKPTALKFAQAQRFENIYPKGIRHSLCQLVRRRAIWRLENGQAVRVGYHIFVGPDGKEPRIPGVTARCEYGIEILVILAFLVYIIGVSLEKACDLLAFFCGLPLDKSQADALLRQLARHWEKEFEALCALLAHAAVVALDETGWKIGDQNCSLWALAAKGLRVFLFGCRKDDATLDKILPPDVFQGIGVSDNAAVYHQRFRAGQKCWAHLLRKVIRLALLYPRKQKYQRFLDQLLQLYYDAKRAAADKRLGEAGRQQRVLELEERLRGLCDPYWPATDPELPPHEGTFANLVNELIQLAAVHELFTFVLHPDDVEATNNGVERMLRGPAQDRKTGRTNKTAAGAHRRSVIVSVLESLRVNLETFDLRSVLAEVRRWLTDGISLFRRQWQEIQSGLAADTG